MQKDLTKVLDKAWQWMDKDLSKMFGGSNNFKTLFQPKLSDFCNLELMDLLPEDELFYNLHGEDTPELLWPFDVGLFKFNSGLFPNEEAIALTRARSVSMADVRGKVKITSKYMAEIMCYDVNGEGCYFSGKSYLAFINGKWIDVTTGKWRMNSSLDEGSMPLILLGHRIVAFWKRYKWGVSIKKAGFPSVRFTTDATGIKSIFKMRDVPENKRRRESLKNWVTEHWRKNRINEEDDVFVRKHLRGALSFSWFGYECTVMPSDYDIEKNLIGARRK